MSQDAARILYDAGLVSRDQLLVALNAQRRDGGTLGQQLIAAGALDETRLARFFERQLLVQRADSEALEHVPRAVLNRVPAELAVAFRLVPIRVRSDGTLVVAMADPADVHAASEVAHHARTGVVRQVATESEIDRALARHYRVALGSDTQVQAALPAPTSMPATPVSVVEGGAGSRLLRRRGDEPYPADQSLAAATTVTRLRVAREVDEVAAALLDLLSLQCLRVALFVCSDNALRGWAARGAAVRLDSLRMIALSLDEESVFRQVVASRLPFRGPLDRLGEEFVRQAFGTSCDEAILVPLQVRSSVVALLYGDDITAQSLALPFDRVASEAAHALERVSRPRPLL
jgi:hypothetical protein